MKYRNKPVVIEPASERDGVRDAFQLTEAVQEERSWPDWFTEALENGTVVKMPPGDPQYSIRNRWGYESVRFGDWVVKGAHGELYSRLGAFDQR